MFVGTSESDEAALAWGLGMILGDKMVVGMLGDENDVS